jgi:PBP1b-binding outer membrane lipoprotein LpoB
MALITCSECGGKISDKATSCPHCGAKAGKKRPKRLLAIIVGGIVILGVVGALNNPPASPQTTATTSASASANSDMLKKCRDVIDSFKSVGLIKSLTWETGGTMTGYELVVSKIDWDHLDFDTKNDVALAAACTATNGDLHAMVEGKVFDNMNHNNLGNFSDLTRRFTSNEPIGSH